MAPIDETTGSVQGIGMGSSYCSIIGSICTVYSQYLPACLYFRATDQDLPYSTVQYYSRTYRPSWTVGAYGSVEHGAHQQACNRDKPLSLILKCPRGNVH